MKIEFSHTDLVKVLELINEYKISKRAFDDKLLNNVLKYLAKYNLPQKGSDIDTEIESMHDWPAHKLFTYGTLMPGQVNNSILKYAGGHWEDAFVKGHLCQSGWGMDYGYPALTWDPKGNIINGKLFHSDLLDWEMLDRLEGSEYNRIWMIIHLKDRRLDVANCYTSIERSNKP